MVYVVDAQGRPVRARTSLGVAIKGSGREQSLNIARDAPFAATFIEVGQSGPIEVRAETAGLKSSAKAIFGCASSCAQSLECDAARTTPDRGGLRFRWSSRCSVQ